MSSLRKEFIKTSLIGFILAIVVMLFVYIFIKKLVINETIQKARLETNVILAYRHYLSLVAPKVKVLDKNLSPFAVTPAYATNQVAKILRQEGFYVKQTSDRYRNVLDKPTPIELKAIKFFEKHKNIKEFYAIHNPDKYFHEKHIFYARKLIIEKSCLKCHGVPYKDVPPKLYKEIVKYYGDKAFNYHLGDVRGIISIITPYQKVINRVNRLFIILASVGIIFFIIGFYLFYKLNIYIKNDILKILNNFKKATKENIPLLKDKMNFIEFENLKNQINETFLTIKKYKGELYRKYNLNPLTFIPNRNKFLEVYNKNKYIIVLLNIDKFKEINFYFGSKIGDELIKEVGKRLIKLKVKYKYKLFHLDIDEFALLFKNISKNELIKIIKDIMNELEKPYNIENNEIIIRFRAGVSIEKKEFLRADVALDMAKDLKKDIVFGKEAESLSKYEEHLKWLKKLKIALENDKIVPFYQPIVNENGEVIKYEALVRLIDEDSKVISPFYFLDVAKKSRLYLEITKRIIDKSIKKIKEKNIAISINLTLEDINNEGMRQFILEKIKSLQDKKLLTFEIVESEDVGENDIVKEFLNRIKKFGSLIYIDDFGSGYSNFDYLIKLNPDGVKIDGSLIKNILTDKNSEIIVKTIISFAKEMEIKTIGEFVENKEIFEKLKFLGVDYFQGYYFSPPKLNV